MSHYITTHDSNGEAVFSGKIAPSHVDLDVPMGKMNVLATTHQWQANVSNELDIDRHTQDRVNGLSNRMCPKDGAAVVVINFAPGRASLLHRTLTFDTCIVLEGLLDLQLGSGELRTLTAGDSEQPRAVIHRWVNVTPAGGWARLVVVMQAIKEPLEIGGKELKPEFIKV